MYYALLILVALLKEQYFSERSLRLLIDDVMSGVANIVHGVPHDSVLDPIKLCFYLLSLGAILKYHGIGYHMYADDTQLYISIKCNNPLASLPKSNNCISDIRVWMTKKEKIMTLKLNYCFFTGKARLE